MLQHVGRERSCHTCLPGSACRVGALKVSAGIDGSSMIFTMYTCIQSPWTSWSSSDVSRSSYGTAASPGGYPTQVSIHFIRIQRKSIWGSGPVTIKPRKGEAGIPIAPDLILIERGRHRGPCQLTLSLWSNFSSSYCWAIRRQFWVFLRDQIFYELQTRSFETETSQSGFLSGLQNTLGKLLLLFHNTLEDIVSI